MEELRREVNSFIGICDGVEGFVGYAMSCKEVQEVVIDLSDGGILGSQNCPFSKPREVCEVGW